MSGLASITFETMRRARSEESVRRAVASHDPCPGPGSRPSPMMFPSVMLADDVPRRSHQRAREQGRTLREVSSVARVSLGYLSEVERGVLPAAIRARHEDGALVASVCTGAMLLAAAGLLTNRPAITHHVAIDDLKAAGAKVTHARVVDDGDVVTAGGVTSGLDLVLHLVERHWGAPLALAAERELEYERRGTVWRADRSLSPA